MPRRHRRPARRIAPAPGAWPRPSTPPASNASTFSSVRRRFTNTYQCPFVGSAPSSLRTSADNPSKERRMSHAGVYSQIRQSPPRFSTATAAADAKTPPRPAPAPPSTPATPSARPPTPRTPPRRDLQSAGPTGPACAATTITCSTPGPPPNKLLARLTASLEPRHDRPPLRRRTAHRHPLALAYRQVLLRHRNGEENSIVKCLPPIVPSRYSHRCNNAQARAGKCQTNF